MKQIPVIADPRNSWPSRTIVEWRYAFTPGTVCHPLLATIANVLWRGYMKKAINLCKSQFDVHKAGSPARQYIEAVMRWR